MLDHVFLDAVAAIRRSLDAALLEHQRHEDRLASDILLGDLVWETSVSLPGEGVPPRVRADLTLDWPTWSQAAWRSWAVGEPSEEPPEIGIELVYRIQRLVSRPDVGAVLAALPERSPDIGDDALERGGPILEQAFADDLSADEAAVEVPYEGTYRLSQEAMGTAKLVEDHLAGLGTWVASTLVRLGDLRFDFLPPDAAGV